MRRTQKSRRWLCGPRSRVRVTAVRARRMTAEEEALFVAACDALLHLLAQRAVEAARGGVGAGAVEETDYTPLTPPRGHGEG